MSEQDRPRDTGFGGVGDAINSAWADTAAAAAVAAAGDGIVAVDDAGVIRFGNAAAAELLARPVQRMVGQPFGLPLVNGRPAEIDVVRPDGQAVAVEIRVSVTTLQGERLHIATLRDITRRRQSERELKAALERQNVVVDVAAHELQNPLFGIRTLVESLRDRDNTLTPERREAAIDRVSNRIDALQTMLRRLLTAARIDSEFAPLAKAPRPGPVRVLDVLVECLADFGDNARQVQVSCPPELAVIAHRGELAEMIGNYLHNAFTHGGPPVDVGVVEQDGRVEFWVCDRGPGVPKSFAPVLFERFSHPPFGWSSAGGSGLGLWIVASLAASNGGRAWYEPRTGGGCCFCLDLPRAPLVPAR